MIYSLIDRPERQQHQAGDHSKQQKCMFLQKHVYASGFLSTAPQYAQKALSSSTGCPQVGQKEVFGFSSFLGSSFFCETTAPQFGQNLVSLETNVPHLEQEILLRRVSRSFSIS